MFANEFGIDTEETVTIMGVSIPKALVTMFSGLIDDARVEAIATPTVSLQTLIFLQTQMELFKLFQ